MSDDTSDTVGKDSKVSAPKTKAARKRSRPTPKKRATKVQQDASETANDQVDPSKSGSEPQLQNPGDSSARPPRSPQKTSNKSAKQNNNQGRDDFESSDPKAPKQSNPEESAEKGSGPVMNGESDRNAEHQQSKRKRRKRGKGDDNRHRDGNEHPNHNSGGRPQLDPDLVAKKAWKVFLAEVSEEGLALINDNDARELSRRSFRLAELFLEEAAKRT